MRNKQRKAESLLDAEDVALGYETRPQWSDKDVLGGVRPEVPGCPESQSRAAVIPAESHESGCAAVVAHRKPTDETALPGTRRHGC